jgi:hypothetical protein
MLLVRRAAPVVVRLTYAGEYGVLDLIRSRIAVHGDAIVGAVLAGATRLHPGVVRAA